MTLLTDTSPLRGRTAELKATVRAVTGSLHSRCIVGTVRTIHPQHTIKSCTEHSRVSFSARVAFMMFFPLPCPLKLEDGSRPTPAASPADVGAAAAPPDEPAPAPDKLDNRRKSTPWKTFNLKRQLSKVDVKFKAAFTVPADTNAEEVTGDKRNSQFYSEPSDKVDAAPESNTESPESDEAKTAEPAEEVKSADKSELSSPLRVCSDVFERMHKELQEKRSSDVYDRMHKELQERWQDKDRIEAGISPDISPSRLEEQKVVRPDNLPLFEEDGRPTRPPRQKGKTKKEEAEKRELRDQRLLSVPNIKYSKREPEGVKDLRRKQPPPTGSFAGSLMRRFSKYPVSAPIISPHQTSLTPGLTVAP